MSLLDRINKFKENVLLEEAKEKAIHQNIEEYSNKLNIISNEYEILLKTQELLNKTSSFSRENAKKHLENIVTMAINEVHDDNCKFEIELSNQRGVPSAEFYVVQEIDGVISKQRPQDSCGGGFIDVISTALRFAYLKAFNTPKLNNAIILDEPGSMVSESASIKFAEFIKKLSELFDKQTILITHNENIKAVADNSILIRKINGESTIEYEK